MLKRKTHRKSRFGCRTCKIRRTKCDEVHPECGNCIKYGASCDFGVTMVSKVAKRLDPVQIPSLRNNTSITVSPRFHSPPPSVAEAQLSNLTPPLQPTIGTPEYQLLDLKLFHHYIQMGQRKMESKPPYCSFDQRYVWVKWITTLAFSNQNLMDAILGFSAHHLRVLNPSDRRLLQVSQKHMAKALSGHAEEVRNGLNEKNAEAVFATSTFIASYSCLSQNIRSGKDRASHVPLYLFLIFRGVRAILEAGREWFKDTEIQPIIAAEFDFVNAVSEYKGTENSSDFGFLLKDLDRETHDLETIKSYEFAVTLLSWIQDLGTARHILRFAAMVSPRFVQLLSEKDPRVLTIVGYFFMILKKAETIWWADGLVDNEFWALMRILPNAWRPRMALACQQFLK